VAFDTLFVEYRLFRIKNLQNEPTPPYLLTACIKLSKIMTDMMAMLSAMRPTILRKQASPTGGVASRKHIFAQIRLSTFRILSLWQPMHQHHPKMPLKRGALTLHGYREIRNLREKFLIISKS
jgi:hypothetical protein